MTKTPEELRSFNWFGSDRTSGLRAFGHRSRMRQLGYALGIAIEDRLERR